MELRTYWSVIWRWRWLALAVGLAVFVLALFVQPREPTLYRAVFQVAVVPNLTQGETQTNIAREQYYEFTTAELLVDDGMYTLKTAQFQAQAAQKASAALGRGVSGSIDAKKSHKVMEVTVMADDPEQAQALAQAVRDLVLDPSSKLFSTVVDFQPKLALAADVAVAPAGGPSRAALYMFLRVVLGLFAGVGLAFLLEYLDDSLRTARDVEGATGLAVLAEIPGGRAAGGSAATRGNRMQPA
ncbi:MAG: hypothetical protein M1401_10485 [Chloroflexi bacterium]|nr:hypothetical protein [Chloroflexota bacterium]